MQPASTREVVVITGASSGIGRVTAQGFARRGAALVLAARSGQELETVAGECVRLGGEALAVPTDVTDRAQVATLAEQAVERFGRIDVWVNDAGIMLLGRLDEAPIADFERVIAVNLLGCAYGARAALAHFRQRGSGILINLGSIGGGIGQPLASAYTASKWAVRGLGDSLRMEVAGQPGIQVCTVLPAVIDTPFVAHTANHTGRRIEIGAPVHAPEQVAEVILRLARHPRAEVTVGEEGRLAMLGRSLLPQAVAARLGGPAQLPGMLGDEPEAPRAGALYEPSGRTAAIHGGWHGRAPSGERVDTALRLSAAALLAAGLLWLAWRRPGPPARR